MPGADATAAEAARTAEHPQNCQASEPPAPDIRKRRDRRIDARARRASRPAEAAASEDRLLLSTESDAAVSGAFSALAHTILAQNARTLEDVVGEMLRPMLKDWLDDNLPAARRAAGAGRDRAGLARPPLSQPPFGGSARRPERRACARAPVDSGRAPSV